MKFSIMKKISLGLLVFSRFTFTMEQPETTACIGFNEELSSIADDVFTCETPKPSSRLSRTPSALIIMASEKARASSSFTLNDHVHSVATETSEDSLASLNSVTDVKKSRAHVTNDKSDKDETLSNSPSENFSAELELGKKGSCCHIRTHFKSKTLAKYAATALGGLLAGLLL